MNILSEFTAHGRFDTTLIRAMGEACSVLGFSDLRERAAAMLVAAPRNAFFAGAIMNFVPDSEAIARLRQLRSCKVLEQEFPIFRLGDVEPIAAVEKTTRLAWQGEYDAAFKLSLIQPRPAPLTSATTEIALTASVCGSFHIAEGVLKDPTLRGGEAHLIRLVLVIEYSRANMSSDANRAEKMLPAIQGWEAIHLALGLAGLRPWATYPYPDY